MGDFGGPKPKKKTVLINIIRLRIAHLNDQLSVPKNRNRNRRDLNFSDRKFKIATLTASSAEKLRNEIANRLVSKSQIPNHNIFCL